MYRYECCEVVGCINKAGICMKLNGITVTNSIKFVNITTRKQKKERS